MIRASLLVAALLAVSPAAAAWTESGYGSVSCVGTTATSTVAPLSSPANDTYSLSFGDTADMGFGVYTFTMTSGAGTSPNQAYPIMYLGSGATGYVFLTPAGLNAYQWGDGSSTGTFATSAATNTALNFEVSINGTWVSIKEGGDLKVNFTKTITTVGANFVAECKNGTTCTNAVVLANPQKDGTAIDMCPAAQTTGTGSNPTTTSGSTATTTTASSTTSKSGASSVVASAILAMVALFLAL